MSIRLPRGVSTSGYVSDPKERTLVISASRRPIKPYVKSLKVDSREATLLVLKHTGIIKAESIESKINVLGQ